MRSWLIAIALLTACGSTASDAGTPITAADATAADASEMSTPDSGPAEDASPGPCPMNRQCGLDNSFCCPDGQTCTCRGISTPGGICLAPGPHACPN